MKHLILSIMVLFLVGCGFDSGSSDDKNAPTMSKDITEENAEFKLTHPLHNSYLPVIDQWWKDIEECTGINMDLTAAQLHLEFIDAPVITYTDASGEVKEAHGAIWVDYQYTRIILRDLEYQWGYVTRHEMMHYILWLDGQNRSHSNPMFKKCEHLMPGTV